MKADRFLTYVRVALFSTAGTVAEAVAAQADTIDLAGDWQLADATGEHVLAAAVPGGVHDALLTAGVLPDPYFGANETNVLWVARRDWTFARDFTVDAHFLAHASIVLRLEDCDTFATIRVNGCTVGVTTDRFQRYDFDVKPFLREGVNRIEGAFRSPVAVADERRQAYGRAYPVVNVQWAKNQALIRKPACHAGWDWGPEIETIGFCGTVALIASDRPRIDYVYTAQTFNDDLTHCTLDVFADLSDGTTVTNRLEIDNPPLWWPNGAGEQKFYTFTVDVNGEPVTKRVGLRKLEVLNEKDETGLSLVFKVNNRRLFMKGANWIPCDALERRQTPERYRNLLDSAARANMNMIRVWGGGQFEKDCFYDACDELGLLVWHDMMCACAAYPAEREFLDEIKGELAHQLRRLRDHASIALWCGDNECLGAINWYDETRADPDFYRNAWMARQKVQEAAARRYDPTRIYWPSSPCCGPGDFGDAWKDDSKGDMHQWDVWHENYPFERYYDYKPRFCSEFGYQSFPSPEVAATFSNGRGDDFEWHQKNDGGNARIRSTMLRYFGAAKDFGSELMLSQFQQAMAIKMAVEAWRSEMPRCMGTLYWQLNDNWPVASWSSIEYGGKWKPLHYAAQRIYAPLAVVGKPDGRIVAINDSPDDLTGELTVEYWSYDGKKPLNVETETVSIQANGATKIGNFATDPKVLRGGSFIVLTLKAGGRVARNDCHFGPYRDQPLAKANVKAKVEGARVTLTTDRPAFFVWLAAPGCEFSDNCLTLLPGRPVTVEKCCQCGNVANSNVANDQLELGIGTDNIGDKGKILTVLSLSDLLAAPRLPRVKLADEIADGRPAVRWRGFNLLDLVTWYETETPPAFKEEDFAILEELGFNFVRLPVDYRWLETNVAAIDKAIDYGRQHKIHVQLCLHRVPGYCSGDPNKETPSLFEDPAALAEACAIWRNLAGRYKGVPNAELSFNLFNEPLYIKEKLYAPVVRALVDAIRAVDGTRFLVADGLGYGRIAPNTLSDIAGLGFGWHCYDPFFVTHHLTPWNDPASVKEPPRWPVDSTPTRKWLAKDIFFSKEWDATLGKDVFVSVGEFGVWRKTRHDIALGLIEDQLKLWQELNCGWALWGLYGGFGILDSERDDVDYEDFHGHKLDRQLLELLQRY